MKKITLTILTGLSVYCSLAQTITATGNLGTARSGHSSQLLNNGNVLVMGGDNYTITNFVAYKSCELYNSSSGTWSAAANMNEIRTYFTSVRLDNGKILVMGGTTGDWYAGSTSGKNTCELYDPTTQTWSYTDTMHVARQGNSFAIKLANGNVLVAGGSSSLVSEIYDASTGHWTITTGNLNEARSQHSMVLLSNGNVLATGGFSTTAEIFDVAGGNWTSVSGSMSAAHTNHQSILLDNNKVLITSGGSTTCELFNPSNNTFVSTGNVIKEKNNCPQVKLADGNILTYGVGDFASPANTKCIEIYNANGGTWSNTTYNTGTNFGANDYTIHKLNNGKILIIGGAITTGNGALNKCYLLTAPTSGINEIASSAIQFEIFPNPANEKVMIKIPSSSSSAQGELVVYDITGSVLMKEVLKSNNTELGVSHLSVGTYFVEVYTIDGSGVQRISVQR